MKLTSLRGYRNPEIEKLHPSAAESLLLLKMSVLCCPGGSPVGGNGMLPLGTLKMGEKKIDLFSKTFRMDFGGTMGRQNDPPMTQSSEKESQKATLAALWADF